MKNGEATSAATSEAPTSTTTPNSNFGFHYSVSARDVIGKLKDGGNISAWEFVKSMLDIHGKYAAGMGERVREANYQVVEGAASYPVHEWMERICELFEPLALPSEKVKDERFPLLDGRLLICGLGCPTAGTAWLREQGDHAILRSGPGGDGAGDLENAGVGSGAEVELLSRRLYQYRSFRGEGWMGVADVLATTASSARPGSLWRR